MKRRIYAPAIATIFLFVMFLAGCGKLTTQTTSTTLTGVNSASSQSANGLELSLSLDTTTYKLYQDVSIVIDEKNTLSKTNNVPVANKWRLIGLSSGPCTQGFPVGIAVFSGYYSSTDVLKGTPLVIFNPNQVYNCPIEIIPDSYSFQPSSDIADLVASSGPGIPNVKRQIQSTITLSGYWNNGANSKFTNFGPGIYTIVGGDEWGALVVLHFTVTNTTATSLITITASSQQPIEVVSVSDTYKAGEPINPGGPTIEITLKNVSTDPIVSLAVTLDEGRAVNYSFDFGITSANPLSPGETVNAKQILIGGGFGGGISYSVIINGTYQDSSTFSFTWEPASK